jgi:hypothetical protein
LVPRAGDLAVGDKPLVQRTAAMGADIVQGEEALRVAKKADLDAPERDAAVFADGNLFQLQGGIDVGHDN